MQYPKLKKTIEHLINKHGPIESRAMIINFVYLADKQWHSNHGNIYTEACYLRGNSGIFSRKIIESIEWMDGIEIIEQNKLFRLEKIYLSNGRTRLTNIELDPLFVTIINKVARYWIKKSIDKLFNHIYLDNEFRKVDLGDQLLRSNAG